MGSCVSAVGAIQSSTGPEQLVEVQVSDLKVIGSCPGPVILYAS